MLHPTFDALGYTQEWFDDPENTLLTFVYRGSRGERAVLEARLGGWEVSNIYVTSGFNVFRVARRAPSGLQRGLLIRPPCPPTFRHCQPSEGKPRLPSCVPSLTTGPRSEVSTPPPPTSFRLRRGADTLPIPAISSRNATAHVKRPQILLTMSIPASFQPQRLGPLYVNFLAAAHQPSSVPSSARFISATHN